MIYFYNLLHLMNKDLRDIPIILSYDNINKFPKSKKKLHMLKKLPERIPGSIDISALSLIHKALYTG